MIDKARNLFGSPAAFCTPLYVGPAPAGMERCTSWIPLALRAYCKTSRTPPMVGTLWESASRQRWQSHGIAYFGGSSGVGTLFKISPITFADLISKVQQFVNHPAGIARSLVAHLNGAKADAENGNVKGAPRTTARDVPCRFDLREVNGHQHP